MIFGNCEAVTKAPLVFDDAPAQLAAQAADECLDGIGIALVVHGVEFFRKFFLAHLRPGIDGEVMQQAEFKRCQFDRAVHRLWFWPT